MAKEWAKPFYRSAAWKAVRRQALQRDAFTCVFCGARATEVHHIRELTPDNIGDPNIALNIDNLQCLCHKCHTTLTMAEHGIKNIDCGMEYYFDADGQLVKFRK